MISIMAKLHVKKRAGHFHIGGRVQYDSLLQKINKMNNTRCKIIFSWMFDMGSNTLNACALLPGVIIINSEWLAHLVLFPNDETINAFKATLGHEMAHKDNDFVFWELGTRDKKFVNWINEVHADFSGADKSFGAIRKNEINAIEYKLKFKGKKDKDSAGHPSWKRRLEYISNYNFNEQLIRRIAEDVKCKNERLVHNAVEHFTDIELI